MSGLSPRVLAIGVALMLGLLSCSDDASTAPFEDAYAASWGLGAESLSLSPGGRYRRVSTGCAESSTTEGCYERRDGVLLLHRPKGDLPPNPYPPEYPIQLHDVRWGERRYLMRESSLLSFCQAINEGSERAATPSGRYLLHSDDVDRHAIGVPRLPDPWSDYLLAAPLEGRTIAPIENHGTWVNLGSESGVRLGMRLFVEDVPIHREFIHLFGGPRMVRELEVVESEVGKSMLVDVQRHQAETMLLPIPAGSVVTSLRPPRH